MKALLSLVGVVLLLVSFGAKADINDRINSCESSGGGSCVYDILREIAARPSGSSNAYCECRISKEQFYVYYADVYKVVVLPNGTEKVQRLTEAFSSCDSGSPTLTCDPMPDCVERLRLHPVSGC